MTFENNLTSDNILKAATDLPQLNITSDLDIEEAMKAMKILGGFNQCMLGLVRFTGDTNWERHPEGEELLYVVSGKTNIKILENDKTTNIAAEKGQIVVIPKGVWHTQKPEPEVTLLFATPAEKTEHSQKIPSK